MSDESRRRLAQALAMRAAMKRVVPSFESAIEEINKLGVFIESASGPEREEAIFIFAQLWRNLEAQTQAATDRARRIVLSERYSETERAQVAAAFLWAAKMRIGLTPKQASGAIVEFGGAEPGGDS